MNKPLRIDQLLARVFVVWLLVTLFIVLFAAPHAQGQTEQTAKTFGLPVPTMRGVMKVYLCTNPGAGIEWTCTVPAGKVWRLLSLTATLVSDATAVNRFASMTVDDGTNVFLRAPQNTAQTATLTIVYSWYPTGDISGTLAALSLSCPTPDIYLGPGYRLKSVTAAIVAGDDWGAPVVYVEEFPVP